MQHDRKSVILQFKRPVFQVGYSLLSVGRELRQRYLLPAANIKEPWIVSRAILETRMNDGNLERGLGHA